MQLNGPSSFFLPDVPEASVPADKVTATVNAASSTAVYPETENPLPTTKAQFVSHHCSDTNNLERMQAASRAVRRNNATEGTARGAKQAPDRLQAEVEAERRSRTTAERWVACGSPTSIPGLDTMLQVPSCAFIVHDGVATCLRPARGEVMVGW